MFYKIFHNFLFSSLKLLNSDRYKCLNPNIVSENNCYQSIIETCNALSVAAYRRQHIKLTSVNLSSPHYTRAAESIREFLNDVYALCVHGLNCSYGSCSAPYILFSFQIHRVPGRLLGLSFQPPMWGLLPHSICLYIT